MYKNTRVNDPQNNNFPADAPKISVIVPVRNMESTIARTLDSLADQNYPNLEILVVEGQSSDSTLQQIERYQNYISCLISEPDGGMYDAVNKGLAHASGDIVGILNGDDLYKHDNVLTLYAEKFDDQKVGIVFGDLEFFLPGKPSKTVRTYSSHGFSPGKLRFGWMPPHPTVFIRKEVYDLVGDYRTDYQISADFEFLIRALWRQSVRFDRIPSVVVRMQYGGLSTRGLGASYRLNREIIRACRHNGLKTNWFLISLKIPAKLREFLPLVLHNGRDTDAAINALEANGSRTIPD